eukprot:1145094-Pelagomonas_calceolata.AAC.6
MLRRIEDLQVAAYDVPRGVRGGRAILMLSLLWALIPHSVRPANCWALPAHNTIKSSACSIHPIDGCILAVAQDCGGIRTPTRYFTRIKIQEGGPLSVFRTVSLLFWSTKLVS